MSYKFDYSNERQFFGRARAKATNKQKLPHLKHHHILVTVFLYFDMYYTLFSKRGLQYDTYLMKHVSKTSLV